MMKNRNAFIILAILSATLSSCATHNARHYDDSGDKFVESSPIDHEELLVSKPAANGPYRFVYLRPYLHSASEQVGKEKLELVLWALDKSGFPAVVQGEQLDQLIIQSGLSYAVTTKSDMLSLHNLASAVGPFLVVEAYTDYIPYKSMHIFGMRVFDPVSAQLVFHTKHQSSAWLSFEKELYNPVFNALKDWFNGNLVNPGSTGAERPREEKI